MIRFVEEIRSRRPRWHRRGRTVHRAASTRRVWLSFLLLASLPYPTVLVVCRRKCQHIHVGCEKVYELTNTDPRNSERKYDLKVESLNS